MLGATRLNDFMDYFKSILFVIDNKTKEYDTMQGDVLVLLALKLGEIEHKYPDVDLKNKKSIETILFIFDGSKNSLASSVMDTVEQFFQTLFMVCPV